MPEPGEIIVGRTAEEARLKAQAAEEVMFGAFGQAAATLGMLAKAEDARLDAQEHVRIPLLDPPVRLLGDRVLVLQDEHRDETTAGGIIVPSVATDAPTEGWVIAVGPEVVQSFSVPAPAFGEGAVATARAYPLSRGDRVIYGRYSGVRVTIERHEYSILRVSDVLAAYTNTRQER